MKYVKCLFTSYNTPPHACGRVLCFFVSFLFFYLFFFMGGGGRGSVSVDL